MEQRRAAATTDREDHFRFTIGSIGELRGHQQPDVIGYRVSIDAYYGVTHRQTFGVDVVTGSLMTAEADVLLWPSLLPAVPGPKVRVYPTVDHVADKVPATRSQYGANGNRTSSTDVPPPALQSPSPHTP